jgi:hypothetical protein
MTKAEVQEIVKNHITEALIDTTTIKDDIDQLFAQWFQGLVQGGTALLQQKAQEETAAKQPAQEAPQ